MKINKNHKLFIVEIGMEVNSNGFGAYSSSFGGNQKLNIIAETYNEVIIKTNSYIEKEFMERDSGVRFNEYSDLIMPKESQPMKIINISMVCENLIY